MSGRSLAIAGLGLALLAPAPRVAAQEAPAPEQDSLRDKLIEREDRRRVPDPITIDLGGRPLTIEGEVAVGGQFLRRRTYAPSARRRDRLAIETTTELELFYSFGPELSLFAQLAFESEHDSGCYLPDHDHSICVQLAQLRWPKTSSTPLDPPPLSALDACPSSVTPPELCRREVRQDSRAPPLV